MNQRNILLLGTPRLELDRRGVHLGRRKALALLAYLAVTGETYTREALATMFWPEHEAARGAAYLRNTLWTIGKLLGTDLIEAEADLLRVDRAKVYLDVATFKGLLPQPTDLNANTTIDRLSPALTLYRGDFMAGFTLTDAPAFDEWQFLEAETLKQQFSEILRRLTDAYFICFQAGQSEQAGLAIAAARRWIALDPLHEPAHHALIRAYQGSGQVAAAERQRQELARILAEELGIADEPARSLAANAVNNRAAGPAPDLTLAPPSLIAFTPLPHSSNPLVGREADLVEIRALLADPACRMLTLLGPGGIGKTRLAVEAARLTAPQTTAFIALAPVTNVAYLLPALASALGVLDSKGARLREQVFQRLQALQVPDSTIVLLFDNFEHLMEGAELLGDILEHVPTLKFLVTSRERLNLQAEWIYEMDGLSTPPEPTPLYQLATEQIAMFGAVQLFIQVARRVRPNYQLSDEDALAVASICRLVDGMPLGLELAAAWMQILDAKRIEAEIQRSIDFLATSARNVAERHRNLRGILAYSWTNLSAAEQACLSALSIFCGGFTIESAQRVAQADHALLRSLHDKSLVRRDGEARYEMHELLRQFATEQLGERQAEVAARHASYFAEFLAARETRLKSRHQARALDEIETEFDNIRAAWAWWGSAHVITEMGQALPSMMHYGSVRITNQELGELVAKAVDQLDAHSPDPEERLLLGILLTAHALREREIGEQYSLRYVLTEAERLLDQFPTDPRTAQALLLLGEIHAKPGAAIDHSEALYRRALALAVEYGDKLGEADATLNLGRLYHLGIRYEEARPLYERALALFREVGQPRGIAFALSALAQHFETLGFMQHVEPMRREAIEYLREIKDRNNILWFEWDYRTSLENLIDLEGVHKRLQYFLRTGNHHAVAWNKYELGVLYLYADRWDDALQALDEGYQGFLPFDDREGLSWARIHMAMAALGKGNYATADHYAVEGLRIVDGVQLPWSVAGAYFALGMSALGRDDLVLARQHLENAVRIAYGIHSAMQTVRHLCGIACVLIAEGQAADAVELAYYARQHPAVWIDVYQLADRVIEQAQDSLTQEQFDAAKAMGALLTMEQAVERFVSRSSLSSPK